MDPHLIARSFNVALSGDQVSERTFLLSLKNQQRGPKKGWCTWARHRLRFA
jgi:hypothetical protein